MGARAVGQAFEALVLFPLMSQGALLSQDVSLQLPGWGFWQFIDEVDLTGVCVCGELCFDEPLKLNGQVFAASGSLGENNVRFQDLTAEFVRGADDGAFLNGRVAREDAFYIEGPDAVSGHDDDIVVAG